MSTYQPPPERLDPHYLTMLRQMIKMVGIRRLRAAIDELAREKKSP